MYVCQTRLYHVTPTNMINSETHINHIPMLYSSALEWWYSHDCINDAKELLMSSAARSYSCTTHNRIKHTYVYLLFILTYISCVLHLFLDHPAISIVV